MGTLFGPIDLKIPHCSWKRDGSTVSNIQLSNANFDPKPTELLLGVRSHIDIDAN